MPTVIFIHGLGLTGDVWAPQQAWCGQHGIESIALTLPGHGARRNDTASIHAMADEVASLAQNFPKVILVGHSFGALLACLAAPKIQNLETIILINPLLDQAQIRMGFLLSIKTAKAVQGFLKTRGAGEFAHGTKLFWRWGIYPYCLMHNPPETPEKLYLEIKKLGKVSLPSSTSYTVLLSRTDWVLLPVTCEKSSIIPVAGHMLVRLAPDEINRFLAQALSHREERPA